MRGIYILKVLFVCGILLSAMPVSAQEQPLKPIPALVKNYQLEKGSFPSKKLFEPAAEKFQSPLTELKDFTSLALDKEKLGDLVKAKEMPEISGYEHKPLTSEKLDRILKKHFDNGDAYAEAV